MYLVPTTKCILEELAGEKFAPGDPRLAVFYLREKKKEIASREEDYWRAVYELWIHEPP